MRALPVPFLAMVCIAGVVAVAAQTAHRSGRQHEDLVAVVGQLADGTVTSHLVNWLSPMKERLTVITGERGAFVADTLTADLTFYAKTGTTGDLLGTTSHYASAIAGGFDQNGDGLHGYNVVRNERGAVTFIKRVEFEK